MPHPLPDSPLYENDVRDIVRLLGAVIATPGGITEKRRFLMDGLCKLVEADTWVWSMAEFHPDKPPVSIGLEHGGWDDERFARYVEAINHPDMQIVTRQSSIELRQKATHLTRTQRQMDPTMLLEHSAAAPFWQLANVGAILVSQRPMAGGGFSGIGLYRELERPHFNEREARIAHIILSEVPWLHFKEYPDRESRELSRLYPRHRTILNYLCEGWSRKKIADQLSLSVNTVHGYTKVIFKHFGVHSQAELLSRFSKGDGGDV